LRSGDLVLQRRELVNAGCRGLLQMVHADRFGLASNRQFGRLGEKGGDLAGQPVARRPKEEWVLRTSCDDLAGQARSGALSYVARGFHGLYSRPFRVAERRRQADHPLRDHGDPSFGRGGQLCTMGALPEVFTSEFAPAWPVPAPAQRPTLHGPTGQLERTGEALQVHQPPMLAGGR
jgi:hypothetical protein